MTVYDSRCLYRATGIALFNLEEDKVKQLDLFNQALKALEMKKIYKSVDEINQRFGKHTVFLGSSFLAHDRPQHERERGDTPERKKAFAKRREQEAADRNTDVYGEGYLKGLPYGECFSEIICFFLKAGKIILAYKVCS